MDGGDSGKLSVLLELAASDDVEAFRAAVEEQGLDNLNEPSPWYGRRLGSRKMSLEERTPTMIAAMYGSKAVLGYILGTGRADVNAASGSDRATALHCAAAGASPAAADVAGLLLRASADPDSLDGGGNRPRDLVKQRESPKTREYSSSSNGVSLPDINEGIYGTDEFRMYSFKVKACSRAYSHDWTECPFVHPGENARRRDPRWHHYSCVPCPEFRKEGACRRGDACDYAHGIFECWLHPAQYRTRLCKDEAGCRRRVCFFAHRDSELRPLYASTGSAVPSPPGLSFHGALFARRSLSFVERSPFRLAEWGPPGLGWGDDLGKLRKSASFGLRANRYASAVAAADEPEPEPEPDVSWVQSLVLDQQPMFESDDGFEEQLLVPAWLRQMYLEQEQLVA